MQKALVTGGAGFVGHHLVNALIHEGWSVAVLDDLSSGFKNQVHLKATFFEGDLRNSALLKEAIQGCDTVFHLAARVELQRSIADPAETFSVNIAGTAELVKACIEYHVKRVVFASSCSVYPLNQEGALKESEAGLGETPYALSKRAGERIFEMYRGYSSLNSCSLRFFNIYGPGQRVDSPYSAVIPKFISSVKKGTPITIYGDGLQTRDFIHIDDVVRAYLLAASRLDVQGVFNIGTGVATSVLALAEQISKLSGGALIQHLPAVLSDARSSYADLTQIQEVLEFKPMIDLKTGLESLIQ